VTTAIVLEFFLVYLGMIAGRRRSAGQVVLKGLSAVRRSRLQRFFIDHSSRGGVAIVVATTMNTAAA
jgi:hypothetical protein